MSASRIDTSRMRVCTGHSLLLLSLPNRSLLQGSWSIFKVPSKLFFRIIHRTTDECARYYARVERVYPPKYSSDPKARDAHKDSPSSSASSSSEDDAPHVIGGDLKIPTKDANTQDNPTLYYYWVHILELEKDKSHDKSKGSFRGVEIQLVGSLMEVQCGMMRYD